MSELTLTDSLRDVFVRPYYLSLLHANFMGVNKDDAAFPARVAEAAATISDQEIEYLLRSSGWRERLVAGWFAGLTNRSSFASRLESYFLPARKCMQVRVIALR